MAEEGSQSPQTAKGGGVWRDVILALLIAASVATAYVVGRYRRTSHLKAFTQCLADKHAKMYGAFWCPHCAEQKELLGSSFSKVPYVECGVPGTHDESAACLQIGVKRFPTWEFDGGERKEGTLPLKVLSEKAGCPLP